MKNFFRRITNGIRRIRGSDIVPSNDEAMAKSIEPVSATALDVDKPDSDGDAILVKKRDEEEFIRNGRAIPANISKGTSVLGRQAPATQGEARITHPVSPGSHSNAAA